MAWDRPGKKEWLVATAPTGLIGRTPNPVSTIVPVNTADVFFKLAGLRLMTVGMPVRFVSTILVEPDIVTSP